MSQTDLWHRQQLELPLARLVLRYNSSCGRLKRNTPEQARHSHNVYYVKPDAMSEMFMSLVRH